MKYTTVFAIVLACMILGVAVGSYMQATLGVPTQDFTVTLAGEGYDKVHANEYAVSITLIGIRDGKLPMTVNLRVKGGTVDVQGYGTFAVSSHYGMLVQKCNYIRLSLKMTGGYYGGHTAVWHLSGTTGTLSGNTLLLSLSADKVILPLKSSPKLYDLTLTGSLTLS